MAEKQFQKRGLNFSISKYKVLNNNTFIPHIRSDRKASIPLQILDNFNFDRLKEPVALLKIKSSDKEVIRIKKLGKDGGSLIMSLKKEKHMRNMKIEMIDIKNSEELQKRLPISKNKIITTASIAPKYSLSCSIPCKKSFKIAPIYLFHYNSNIIAGSYLSRKDIIFKEKFELDELACSSIGLYEAEGGKVAGSFTNSQPKMINVILNFIEKTSEVKRENLTASINCNENMRSKKRNLEKFWKNQTGIEKFHNNLHLTKKKISFPNGNLQVFFSSKILKEFMCGMFNLVFKNNSLDHKAIIRGLLSGDGSPLQQTNTYITHHIATDKNYINFQEKFINKIFKDKVSTIKKISNKKIVIYNNWRDNLNFLFLDPYKFNIFNRLKFANQLLNLKTTKAFINIREGDIIKGVEIARNKLPINPLIKSEYIELKQISPKPNKKYNIILTKKGIEKQREIKNFINNIYPNYIKDIIKFNEKLKEYNLT